MIDEDLSWDMNEDGSSGIAGVDEDEDTEFDERSGEFFGGDDDEDGLDGEDLLNGIDDDGDGNIDEDLPGDMNGDGASGVAGIDDDGDGLVDEGTLWDDDEDGNTDEVGLHPIIFHFDSGTGTLNEWNTVTGDTVVLCSNVTAFEVVFQRAQLITISLTLQSGDDQIVFIENVCLRNVEQRVGKRVR